MGIVHPSVDYWPVDVRGMVNSVIWIVCRSLGPGVRLEAPNKTQSGPYPLATP